MEDDLKGWGTDPVKARKYLIESCGLAEDKVYGFYFEDGTGFCGRVENFIPYLIRRFKWNPEDRFEIDKDLGFDGYTPQEGELTPPPEVEGVVWEPDKKDPRF